MFSYQSIQIGYVVDSYYSTEEQCWLYDILATSHRDNNSRTVKGVKTLDSFGAQADFYAVTLRKPDQSQTGLPPVFPTGARVLLAFMDNSPTGAIILGGVSRVFDWKAALPEGIDQTDYPCLLWQFNGVFVHLTSAGSFRLSFRGPMDNFGQSKLTEEQRNTWTGSYIEIRADGTLAFGTKDQSFSFTNDGDNKGLQVTSKQTTVAIEGGKSETIDGDFDSQVTNGHSSHSVSGDWDLSASNAQVRADNNITFTAGTKTFLDGAVGNQLGLGTNSMLLGTQYRLAQGVLHQAVTVALTALSAAIATAGGQLAGAGNLMTTPTVGAVSAAPLIIGAGALLASAVAPIAAIITAIHSFEAAGATYLSNKNTLD